MLGRGDSSNAHGETLRTGSARTGRNNCAEQKSAFNLPGVLRTRSTVTPVGLFQLL